MVSIENNMALFGNILSVLMITVIFRWWYKSLQRTLLWYML